jgi:DNA-directed RNA polymerase subunit E'/Rpb7
MNILSANASEKSKTNILESNKNLSQANSNKNKKLEEDESDDEDEDEDEDEESGVGVAETKAEVKTESKLEVKIDAKAESKDEAKGKAKTIKKIHKQKFLDIYMTNMITRRVTLSMSKVGNNIKSILEKMIAYQMDGKCVVEGYIKPNSIKIISYSNGIIKGDEVAFEVVFECLVCLPVEGMHITAIAKNITKAGIRAEINEEHSPLIIFIARDHNYKSAYFSSIKENDEIKVRVIGQRYELNDTFISIIAELLDKKEYKPKEAKPFIIIN